MLACRYSSHNIKWNMQWTEWEANDYLKKLYASKFIIAEIYWDAKYINLISAINGNGYLIEIENQVMIKKDKINKDRINKDTITSSMLSRATETTGPMTLE